MKTVNVQSGQSILDISIQHTGTIENIFDIARAAGASITDILLPGSTVTVDDSPGKIEKKTLDYLASRNISPATVAGMSPELPSGLGNEYLEYPEPQITIE